ncbi:hypothetical protein ACEPPN_009213 [Leptodophora sp. 'Broadleaf-Isolate-01']
MRVLRLPIAPITAEEETKTLMGQYYPIFDKAFFFGQLSKDGKSRIKVFNDDEGNSYGFYVESEGTININMTMRNYEIPRGEEQLGHASTWINAMVNL